MHAHMLTPSNKRTSGLQGDADEHNVLRLKDYFYHKEHLFLVTELLKDNLYEFQKYLSDAGEPEYFTLPRIQSITRQVLDALAFIHSRGLIHCDLKVRAGVPARGEVGSAGDHPPRTPHPRHQLLPTPPTHSCSRRTY